MLRESLPSLVRGASITVITLFGYTAMAGAVGAGGIGQELMTNIKLDRYDQVSITLLLIILVVSALDMLSGRLRLWVLEGKK